jgi:hypothetical protein
VPDRSGVAVGSGIAVPPGVTVDPGVAVGPGVPLGRGVGVGADVGRGVDVGWGVVVGRAVGVGTAVALGFGVGVAVGAVIVTVPAATASLNRRVSAASNEIAWVPAASFVDHVLRAPAFQFVPPDPVIAWATPSMTTETWSGAEPSRFR